MKKGFLNERQEFVKLATKRPDLAANLLRKQADTIEKQHTTEKVLKVLSKALFTSERTLWRDVAH